MASSPKANSSSTKSTRDVEKALLTTNLVAALAFPAPVVLAPGPWHKLMFKEGQPRNQDMNQFFALALARVGADWPLSITAVPRPPAHGGGMGSMPLGPPSHAPGFREGAGDRYGGGGQGAEGYLDADPRGSGASGRQGDGAGRRMEADRPEEGRRREPSPCRLPHAPLCAQPGDGAEPTTVEPRRGRPSHPPGERRSRSRSPCRPPHAAPSGQPGRPQRFSSGGGGGGGGQPASTQSGQGDDAAAVGQMAQAWRHRRALLSQEAGRAGGHQGGDERRAPEPAFVRNGDPWEPLAQGEGGSSGHGGGGGRRLEDAQAEAPRLEAWREAEGDRGPTSGRAEEPAPAPGWTSARAWAEEVHRFLLNQPDHRAGVAQLRRAALDVPMALLPEGTSIARFLHGFCSLWTVSSASKSGRALIFSAVPGWPGSSDMDDPRPPPEPKAAGPSGPRRSRGRRSPDPGARGSAGGSAGEGEDAGGKRSSGAGGAGPGHQRTGRGEDRHEGGRERDRSRERSHTPPATRLARPDPNPDRTRPSVVIVRRLAKPGPPPRDRAAPPSAQGPACGVRPVQPWPSVPTQQPVFERLVRPEPPPMRPAAPPSPQGPAREASADAAPQQQQQQQQQQQGSRDQLLPPHLQRRRRTDFVAAYRDWEARDGTVRPAATDGQSPGS